MKIISTLFGLACFFATTLAAAQTTEANIKKLIEPRLGKGAQVQSVLKTPYSGLYEVQIDGDVIYTDVNARYLFIGRVVDAQSYRDFTKERVEAITKVKFSDLPLDQAIKIVKGNGKRVIAVFEDPNCMYCKRFHKSLEDVDNITIYSFQYNILSPDSIEKSRNVWCSSNPAKAWSEVMSDGKAPPAAAAGCVAPHEKVLALGQKLKITGTPTIFFADGTRIPGAIDAKGLEQKLSTVK
ncbi:DsbC family protein [Herbaspirillum sp. RTI4]|uniref:DsbC family protein n=1 Tax=Herbaspirillum sp. RTI4 TaxID=3048640 RepID=UPI002AB470FB|nr:DsbC family protein [Herbaspirillum sp. RTI4]MDY7576880.1 DsbC family protein [Herbaspirillum sp. RTI4]MEA9982513.1 DsbC family protein [Herbaspirillum sp. RTI4]